MDQTKFKPQHQSFSQNVTIVKGDINLGYELLHKAKRLGKDTKDVYNYILDVRKRLIKSTLQYTKINKSHYYSIYRLIKKDDGLEVHVITPNVTASVTITKITNPEIKSI